MAIGALEALVSMYLAVKHDLASALAIEFDGLAGRDRERGNRHREGHDRYEG
jgi:hypothetical protein